MSSHFIKLGLCLVICSIALAHDPSPLQDFCVKDTNNPVLVNGALCKDPNLVVADDFFLSGLNEPGNTSNPVGSRVTLINGDRVPGLNTLGISLARVDYAPWGLNPPHTHPRATEILTLVKGTLQVGFITSNPENRLFTKILHEGDVFVFPRGLVHFQRNIGDGYAQAFSGLSSQNPGINTIANIVFGSDPNIPADVIADAFQVDRDVVVNFQSNF